MANELYYLPGPVITFNGEAGADVALSMEGVADGAARISAQYDRGAGAQPAWYKWQVEALWQATPVVDSVLNLYIAHAFDDDNTMIAGDPGLVDAALGSLDQLKNMQVFGNLIVETADTTKMVSPVGLLYIDSRYFSIVVANEGGSSLSATDADFTLKMQASTPQGQ